MSPVRVCYSNNLELNALGGITAILKYSMPELNEMEDENVFQQDTEEDDDMNIEQFKKLDINNHDDMNFSDDDKKKEDEVYYN
jgi:hypothetical protein